MRSVLVVLLSVACASCAVDPISPNIWSLSRTDASGQESYLGGHYTLEACQRAGVEWFTEVRGDSGVLQCVRRDRACRLRSQTSKVAGIAHSGWADQKSAHLSFQSKRRWKEKLD